MARGALRVLQDRLAAGTLHGVIGLGGLQGTAVCTEVMRALPYGLPEDHGVDGRVGRHLGLRRRHGHHHDVLRGRHHRPERVPAEGAGQCGGRRARHGAGRRVPAHGAAGQDPHRHVEPRRAHQRRAAGPRRVRVPRLRGHRLPRGRLRRTRHGAHDAPGHHRRGLRLRDGRDHRRALRRPARRRPGAPDRGRRSRPAAGALPGRRRARGRARRPAEQRPRPVQESQARLPQSRHLRRPGSSRTRWWRWRARSAGASSTPGAGPC